MMKQTKIEFHSTEILLKRQEEMIVLRRFFMLLENLQSVLLTHQHLELKVDNSYIKPIYHHNELEYEVDIVSYQRRYLVNYDKIEI